jgi:hypothetical protein
MSARRLLLWVAAALLLAGCPLSSQFPLDSPADAQEDAALLGIWRTTADNEEPFTLTIRAAGGGQLLFVAESPEEEAESFPAFVSAVGGELFLNLQDAAEAGEWYFANYRIEGERLLLRLVDDELFASRSFASGPELRAFLLENLHAPALYGGQGTEEWDWVLERSAP